MSLPSSEPLPNDINDLPPARQRHIRRQPRSATIAERQILLESLVKLTAPTLNFFLLSLLGALTAGAAMYFDEPVILVASAVLFPFLSPFFGIAILPTTINWKHGLKCLVSLLILFTLSFCLGALFGWLKESSALHNIPIFRFSAPYWLDLTIVGVCTILGVFVLLRQGKLPQLVGVLLAYEILVPLSVAGFGFSLADAQLWPGALWVGLAYSGVSIILSVLTFLIIGFPPKRLSGWLMAVIGLFLTLLLLTVNPNLGEKQAHLLQNTPIAASPSLIPTSTSSPKAISSATPTFQRSTKTATDTHTPDPSSTPSQTATQTPTLKPTTYWAEIDTVTGAVIRESPAFDAPVVGYANHRDQIEIFGELTPQGDTLWYQVQTGTGESGWMLGSLIKSQTPTMPATEE